MENHEVGAEFDDLVQHPPNVAMLMAAYHLKQARLTSQPHPDQFTAERELRAAIDDLVTPIACACSCGEVPQVCECLRCVTWLQNRAALEELGVYVEGLRTATSFRSVPLGDVTPLIEDLRRLTTEGTCGKNFLVVSNGAVFVQFLQFLEPTRDTYLTCEIASDEALFVSTAQACLKDLGFSAPTAPHADPGDGPDRIVTTDEETHSLFYRHLWVYDEPESAVPGIAELTVQLFRHVFGLPFDATFDLELHIEAGT